MGTFIRETMRGDERIRDKGSPQFAGLPTVTRSVEIITDPAPPLPDPIVPSGNVFGGGSSHPWQVTASGANQVSVAAGFMFGVISKRTSVGVDASAWDFVWIPTKFNGSTIAAITSTSYIYAKMSLYDGFNGSNTNIILHWPQRTYEMDEAESRVFQPHGAITVYASANAPDAEGTSGGEQWIVPIAKVVVADGVVAVEEQYLTHNPTQQLGFFSMQTTPISP